MARHAGEMRKGYRERAERAITQRPPGPALRTAGIIEAMTEEKTKLLRSLAIDRGAGEVAQSTGTRRRWLPVAGAGVAVIAAAAVAVFGLPEFRGLRGAEPAVAQSQVTGSPQPQPPQQGM